MSIDKWEAFHFLQLYQPLPSDQELNSQMDILDKYDIIREFFLANPDPTCIPLFLHSFGDGSGFGVYQVVEDVIVQFSNEEVIPHLINALQSKFTSVRYWCSQIASNFPDIRLIDPLKKLLSDTDADIRTMAIYALEAIDGDESNNALKNQLDIETDAEIILLLKNILIHCK